MARGKPRLRLSPTTTVDSMAMDLDTMEDMDLDTTEDMAMDMSMERGRPSPTSMVLIPIMWVVLLVFLLGPLSPLLDMLLLLSLDLVWAMLVLAVMLPTLVVSSMWPRGKLKLRLSPTTMVDTMAMDLDTMVDMAMDLSMARGKPRLSPTTTVDSMAMDLDTMEDMDMDMSMARGKPR